MLRVTFRSPNHPSSRSLGAVHWRAADKTCSVSRIASPCQNDLGAFPYQPPEGGPPVRFND